jgi:hypothetical protein
MADPAGEVPDGALPLNFDARLKLQFRGAAINCDAGLKAAEPWSLTSLREKLAKIGTKVVSHGRYVVFQMAEVAVPRQMFADILTLIARLRAPPAPA